MKRFIICLLISMWVTCGAAPISHAMGGTSFYKKIDKINRLVDNDQWRQAEQETSALKKMYKKKQWKLQLLGDEAEYEGIDENLDKLNAAIQAKGKVDTKMELAMIRALLHAIYTM